MSSDPNLGRYVPMDLYLADRKDLRDWMSRMEAKQDDLIEANASGAGGASERRRLAALAAGATTVALGAATFLLNSIGAFS